MAVLLSAEGRQFEPTAQAIRNWVAQAERAANVLIVGIIAAAVFLPAKPDFTSPFQFVDWKSGSTDREWKVTSYMGTQVMDRLLPEDSVVGSWDAGVIGYFSRFPVVNLDGVVNSYDYLRARKEGTEVALYRRYGINHFANVDYVNSIRDATLFEDPPYCAKDDSSSGPPSRHRRRCRADLELPRNSWRKWNPTSTTGRIASG